MAFLALVVVRSAHAETRAESLVDEGIELRRQHRDAEALEVFRRALELDTSPRTRAQIALAEQALGQWAAAEKDLSDAVGAADDPWIHGHADLLESALTGIQEHLGTLILEANVDKAELWINGQLAGELPVAPVRVLAGAVDIEVRRPGHDPVRRHLNLPPAATVRQTIEFVIEKQIGAETRAARTDGIGAPKAIETPADGDAEGRQTASKLGSPAAAPALEPSGMRRTIGWSLLGGAGAFLAAGIVAQIVREQSTAHYNDDALCMVPGLTRDQACGTYRGRADTASALATVAYIGAATLGLSAAVLFLTAAKAPTTSQLRLRVDVSNVGLYASCVTSL